jgi:hypothetical protein
MPKLPLLQTLRERRRDVWHLQMMILKNARRVKYYWEIIADNLSKAGWSWGCVSAIDSNGRTIWIVDAHRDTEKHYVVHADEKLTAFLELELITRGVAPETQFANRQPRGPGVAKNWLANCNNTATIL